MTSKFAQQIAAFNRKYESRLRAVGRGAVQDVVELAQMPGPSIGPPPSNGAGGRMPIVIGFLRASIQAALGQMPSGPTTNDGDAKHPVGTQVAGEPVSVVLLRWDPNKGTPFFVGWTAAYARHMESYYGYLRGATELWVPIVEGNARHIRTELG